MGLEFITYGPRSLLVTFGSREDDETHRRQLAFLAAMRQTSPAGLVETTPAFTTVLLRFSERRDRDAGVDALREGNFELKNTAVPSNGRLVEFPVHYDGPDLKRVAAAAGLTEPEAMAAHCAPTYRVRCLGFSPGFPYLSGLDPRLHTPRLAAPRPRVAAGSVAIGGSHTGVYSVAGPGGWNLIGVTKRPLFLPWKESLAEMFAVQPGDEVRFIDSGLIDPAGSPLPPVGALLRPDGERTVPFARVLDVGLGISIQDKGRPGYARYGVPPGGAMDPFAARWANLLLENPPNAPVLEFCLQGQRLEMLNSGWVSLTGAVDSFNGSPGWSAVRMRRGEVLEIRPGKHGIWSYLAVPGGVAAPRILGSYSTHPRAGIGPTLGPGDIVSGFAGGGSPASATACRRVAKSEIRDYSTPRKLRVWLGPQWRLFSTEAMDTFFASEWIVSSRSDRSGFRLRGPVIEAGGSDMNSEPVLPGTVQIPSGGEPIVTMPDGPTLGGYPKLGIVEPEDLEVLAQVRPGHGVRFVRVE